MSIKVVHISDTHMYEVPVPNGDILIHSGDGTFKGTEAELTKLNQWLSSLPHTYKLYVPGNHDWMFELDPVNARLIMDSCTVLINEQIEVMGLSIYGTPDQPQFGAWAFNRSPELLVESYKQISEELDILVTHCPPYTILDKTERGENVGSPELLNRVLDTKPRYHMYGHIHEDYGTVHTTDTVYMNTSICNAKYRAVNKPQVIKIKELW